MIAPQVLLVDVPGEQGRTTVTLLGSLAARLATLSATSGSDAIGAIAAGYAALGRAVAEGADGALMRRAIESSVAGANGEAIWRRLRIGEWTGSLPPAPVFQQLQNDIALLAASDIDRALELPLAPPDPAGATDAEPAAVTFADFLTGMWFFSWVVVTAVEHLTRDETARLDGAVDVGGTAHGDRSGPFLR
jgi:hypothetical protein